MTLSILLSTIAMVMVSVSIHGGIAFGQAVPLIPINSGNSTLDKGLPVFYDCIDEKIDNSKGAEEDDYFEKEPTKNEVTTCYEETFLTGSDTSSSDETDTSSSDETDTSSSDETDTSSSDETDTSSSDETDTSSSDETDTSSSDDSQMRASDYTSDLNGNIAKFNELFGY
ncbi:hypothetical protein [Candidatus Nitrosocosmicus sp. SS]|uniref:hypothetical protein n=1 Tax=Candidatus Nitrosocosmicus agrestis TaxID=2563600 RepID=UPI0018A826DC|nr:hypothetical protein [Candidatus Nitrosocosmicus sp. SS]